MFRRKFAHRMKVGRFLGIDLFIHWTFWLLLLGVGAWSFQGEDGGWEAAAASMLRIAALFVCVTLHEYGHAMMARLFSVRTVDITLLPIGGLARLERMPRIPWQEFLVAVAGPAVNVVIAAVIAASLIALDPSLRSGSLEAWESVLAGTSIGWLLLVNVVLVLFNMIPAFPMDGGRVLRSLLATILEYRQATRVAARIGLVAAAGMAMLGWQNNALQLILVAAFIGYAGWVEARQVEFSEGIRGIQVHEAMIPAPKCVSAMTPLEELVEFFSRNSDRSIPVVGVNHTYLGMLDIEAVAIAVQRGRLGCTALDLVRDNQPVLSPDGELERQIGGAPPQDAGRFPVVNQQGHLIGLVDFDCAVERTIFARSRHLRQPAFHSPAPTAPASPVPPGSLRDSYI